MAHTKSAIKRAKTSAKRQSKNRAAKSAIQTLRRKLEETIGKGDKSGSEAEFRRYSSTLDKAVKHGIIRRNAAARRKSIAARKIAGLADQKVI